LQLRDEKVLAKGKGELVTYWLDLKSNSGAGKSSSSSGSGNDMNANSGTTTESSHNIDLPLFCNVKSCSSGKVERLIDWNADTLRRLLQRIVDNRRVGTLAISSASECQACWGEASTTCLDVSLSNEIKPFDEVKEITSLPQVKACQIITDKPMYHISSEVTHQLRDYVSSIAKMYNNNHFHNFEHVCLPMCLCADFPFLRTHDF
jgi:hypothetical protein